MASLQTDPSGTYHICFRFGGRRYKRSLKTKEARKAESKRRRLEENLELVASGRLDVPETADPPVFLLSDGKLNHRPEREERLRLNDLFHRYFAAIPDGNLEASTVEGMKTHQRHLERHLGTRLFVDSICRETLQDYVHERSKANGIRGRKLSPATIKKELVTLRTVWNWALVEGLVKLPFMLKGVRFPKFDEKPRFQTWDEITRQIACGYLSDAEILDLWDCLFLDREQVEELLDYVQKHATHAFIYPMFVAAAHTGARRSELMRSRLLDFDHTYVTIREKKRVRGQRSTRRVPLSDRLAEAIDQWKSKHPGGPFTFSLPEIARSKKSRESLGEMTRDEANHHFQRTLLGSKWSVLRGWHCLRHSFCSNCAAEGLEQRVIDSWVGHTTESMRRRYRHLFPSREREAIQRVFSSRPPLSAQSPSC